ncbi:ATP-dependent nuclease [Sphingobium yanoikuyae]|jgi:putative ATP-dependent endonuclease of the OLD family|uniref:ATP-dependent nuclease n=1 Tax=Sphingobium yanoikuyae TaxID=13690 RepID=UPI0013771AA6|nr:ATP-dependent endonuclease [Sphingobium yanoikuyae]NBB39138.1 AAA family ATPase [Sphingobium yanoikuyae]
MKITKVRVEGFRLLEDLEVAIEPTATVIVGRNNSGKTSLTEVFERFLGERASGFRLEDFSAGTRARFFAAKALREKGDADPQAVLQALPRISLTLTVEYDITAKDLGPLSPFVIDLNATCHSAIIRLDYRASLSSLQELLEPPALAAGDEHDAHFIHHLREAVPSTYSASAVAIDPTDPTNERRFESLTQVAALVQCGFVTAQRILDQSKRGDADVLGKLLSKLFQTAAATTAAIGDQEVAANLKSAVAAVEKVMQKDFDGQLKGLLPTLDTFGFPSLNDTELRPQTNINVGDLLSENTRIFYTGSDGVHLPEGYNGLGTRNLIYILLQLESFHKIYRASPTRPGTNLIFLEEPEAHLHPQMQEVFISQLQAVIKTLSKHYPDEPAWQVQFIVTTHSSHLANAAQFEAVRYFLNVQTSSPGVRKTKVKDFRKGMNAISAADREFLHQYMTLTKCDLYFADKAILVEGPTERILMPRICKLVDAELEEQNRLDRQFVTTVEVGGAYAQIFYPLLDFLELKTLVITDLDAVRLDETKEKPRWVKCPCAQGSRTSNSAIKAWFGAKEGEQIALADLHQKQPADKLQGFRRIAYQIPEDGSAHCPRSYEDALILANLAHFEIDDNATAADAAWEAAQDFSKADEAIRFAITETDWRVPKYIREGLAWLSEPPPAPEVPPPLGDEGSVAAVIEQGAA